MFVEFALPYGKHAEASSTQRFLDLLVPRAVSLYLRAPKLEIDFRETPSTTMVTVPEAAMDEDAPGTTLI